MLRDRGMFRAGPAIGALLVCLLSVATLQGLAAGALAKAGQRAAPASITPQELARIWDAEHVSPPLPPLLDHAEVVRRLGALTDSHRDLFEVEKIGESVEGRSINHVRVGRGAVRVMLWSQMHGDEPTATSALFDLFEYLQRHRDDPPVRRILSELTLDVVPMVNPDGAERFQRRNAQSIDINRDALRLQTPEGRVLKALRDRLNPRVGFNLHNQNWRTSVGDPPKPASISLLSVAYDEARTENAGRRLTKKLCAVIRDSLEPFASGQIGRYDDEFEVRAFGDNITLWGTPVVLIETGPWPSETPDPALVRLNFIALVSALDALATGQVERADPKRYETLPVNESRAFYVLVQNATVIAGTGVPPFIADIGIVANRRVRTTGSNREIQLALNIDDVGDLRTQGALRTIDATGKTVVVATDDSFAEGKVIDLPEWRTKTASTIAVGQPARMAILRPAGQAGKFLVEVVLRSQP
jgi:hypothetical protein